MREISFVPTTEYEKRAGNVTALLADAVHMLVVSELLLMSFLRMLQDEFPAWTMESGGFLRMQFFLVATILLFGVIAPATGRFHALTSVGLEMGYFALGGWYAFRHAAKLRSGVIAVYEDYLKAWNEYYQTNYFVNGGERDLAPEAFFFVVLVFLLLLLMLRYASGQRWPLLIMPLGALALGFLVDVLPGWPGLAMFFVGLAVICAGVGDSTRFHAVSAQKTRKLRPAAWRLGALARTALLAILILVLTPWAFGRPVGQIPEKAPEMLAFQQNLEAEITDLGNSLAASDEERVDNATPKYRDKLMLEVTADVKPKTNLYLADFYSGTYQRGRWLQIPWEYREAARADRIDRDRLGALLRQMPYESSRQIRDDGNLPTNYRINYKMVTDRALVPYFTDVAGIDDAWVVDEGLVKKRRFQKSLEFVGSSVWDLVSDSGQNGRDGADWYSAYAAEHYVKESGIPAVERQADLVRRESSGVWSLHTEGIFQGSSNSDPQSIRRLMLADAVRQRLAKLAVYDLYLDEIPAGTDTIQYFLETGHEGYCMHFASAGALILQELGVPARYASGYIVKQQAFRMDEETGEFVAPVYDRNGHAWVEIYIDNVGWIPWEMTPGYETYAEALPTDAENQEQLKQESENKNSEVLESSEAASGTEPESETASGTEPASENGDSENSESDGPDTTASNSPQNGMSSNGGGAAGSRRGKVLWIVVAVVAVLALAFLIWVGIVLGMRRYRALLGQEIRRKQHRRAVRRINRRIYCRLQKGFLWWSGMTDAEYERKLADTYRRVAPEDWKRYMQIVKKVAFSREEVSDEEMRLCLMVYRTR